MAAPRKFRSLDETQPPSFTHCSGRRIYLYLKADAAIASMTNAAQKMFACRVLPSWAPAPAVSSAPRA